MKLLLDTCVLSELKQKKPNPSVKAYLLGLKSAETFISAITIGEIAKGIQLLEPGKKKTSLEGWLDGLDSAYGDRILPITSDICRVWGEISSNTQKKGITLPAIDGLIAATAIHHRLHLVTRNVSDFEGSGVLIINPWELTQ